MISQPKLSRFTQRQEMEVSIMTWMREFLRNVDFKQVSYAFVALRISSQSAARYSNASGMLQGISQPGSGRHWIYSAIGGHRIFPLFLPAGNPGNSIKDNWVANSSKGLACLGKSSSWCFTKQMCLDSFLPGPGVTEILTYSHIGNSRAKLVWKKPKHNS